MEAVSNNYYHVCTYRKCNDCGYIGEDLSFKIKLETTHQSDNAVSQIVRTHCPECDSEKLSGYFNTKEEVK
jgi:predicted Zn-ribbon and HTH transcriptional regulator